jgi:hypothetical protein
MTTAANDHESLAFMRKANTLLHDAGWTWDRLLRGSVTVIADPFDSLPEPSNSSVPFSHTTPPRPRAKSPNPPPPPNPTPPPPPSPPPFGTSFGFNRSNQHPGFCYCCGNHVGSQDGYIFKPAGKWEVICTNDANRVSRGTMSIPSRRARQKHSTVPLSTL